MSPCCICIGRGCKKLLNGYFVLLSMVVEPKRQVQIGKRTVSRCEVRFRSSMDPVIGTYDIEGGQM